MIVDSQKASYKLTTYESQNYANDRSDTTNWYTILCRTERPTECCETMPVYSSPRYRSYNKMHRNVWTNPYRDDM